MFLKFDSQGKHMVVQSFQFKSSIFLSIYCIPMQNELLKIRSCSLINKGGITLTETKLYKRQHLCEIEKKSVACK